MRALERLLVATMAWGVLAFGAVYPWAYWPLAASAFGMGLWAVVRTGAWRDPRLRTLTAALAAVATAMALQLVPLPYGIVQALAPGMDGFLREYLLGYEPPSWHALSIDSGQTAVTLALLVAFGTLLIGLTRAVRYMRLDWLLTQLLGLGVALAIAGVLQKALAEPNQPLVYGFWRPVYGGNPFGPFVNRNHFAGWMLMALPLVIGYAAAELERAARPRAASWRLWLRWLVTTEASRFLVAAVGVLSMGMSVVLTGSRSGVAGLAVALGAFGYFVVRRASGRRPRALAAASMAALLAAILLWAGPAEIVERFASASGHAEGRLSAWRDTWRIMQAFPAAGTGLGTYGLSMLVYQTAGRPEIYLQAHNDYIQIASEGGLLVGLPALALVGVIVSAIRRRLRAGEDDTRTRWIRAGAVAGLLGIAAQSLVEFSLQMPGNTLLFVVVAAIAMHRPSRVAGAHRV